MNEKDQASQTDNAAAGSSNALPAAAFDILEKESKSSQKIRLPIDESQNKLNNIIKRLSEDYSMIDNQNENTYIEEIKAVYTDTKFRHSYTELTRIILGCYDNGDKQHTLENNFQRLHELIEERIVNGENEQESYIKGFRKLYDHFNLEIARLRYIDGLRNFYECQLTKANNKINNYEKQLKTFKNTLQDLTTDYNKKIDDKFSNASTQSMTILGIFSAIVFAFTGGFGVIGSTFDNGIRSAYPLRFIFTVLLLCFSLFNILVWLVSTLFKLSDGKVLAWPCKFAKSSNEREICKGCTKQYCCLVFRLFRRYPFIAIIDTILIVGMIITFILWLCGKLPSCFLHIP
jgi:hypothetical protein